MNREKNISISPRSSAARHAPFRLTPMAAIVGSLLILGAVPAIAAESPTVEELEAEIARLKQQLARQAQGDAAAAPAVAPVTAAGFEPKSEPTTKDDEPQSLDAVVVRSRSGLEKLKDVPQSASVVTGKELDALGATTLSDFTRRAANVTRNSGNPRTLSLSVRGVGKKGITEAQDPSVGTSVDGVSFAYNSLATWDFIDVDTVEVARGPQGSLGGKNTSLGSINISTRKPTFAPTAEGTLRLGQNNALYGDTVIGGGLVDDLLAWRGTFYVHKQEGDFINAYDLAGGDKYRERTYIDTNKISGRLQFLLTPTVDVTARVAIDIEPKTAENFNGLNFFHDEPATYSNGTPVNLATSAQTRLARRWFTQNPSYTYRNNYVNYDTGIQNNDEQRPLVTGMKGIQANLDWNVRGHTLSSITAWKGFFFDARNDEGTPYDISLQGGGGVRYSQFTQELKITSQPGGLVDYVAGLYYLRSSTDVDSKSGWGSDAGAWFANAAQYKDLDATAAGRNLLTNSLAGLRKNGLLEVRNTSPAIYANANWHLSEPITLATGFRLTKEDRKSRASAYITDNGFAPELNASISSNGLAMGGFDSYFNSGTSDVWVKNGYKVASSTAGAVKVGAGQTALTTDTTNAALLAQANAQANNAAKKYFNAASWSALTDAQKKSLAYAQQIRKSQTGQLYNPIVAEPFQKTQKYFTLSPSYKFNEEVTAYVTGQYGEKAGISQVTNGFSAPADAEKTTSVELGLKSSLFNNTLVLNADVFYSKIRDYQQAVQVVDEFTTAFNNDGQIYYVSSVGNVPKVRVRGLEVDGAYYGIQNTSIRFSGALNDAIYEEFTNAGQPPENGYAGAAPYRDLSGQRLPGAARFTGNLGVDYRQPVFGNYLAHTSVNYAYTSRYNNDVTLSELSWIDGYGITDFSVGFGRRDGLFDVSLLAKNLFNAEGKAYNFSNGTLETTPRWLGVVVTGKLR